MKVFSLALAVVASLLYPSHFCSGGAPQILICPMETGQEQCTPVTAQDVLVSPAEMDCDLPMSLSIGAGWQNKARSIGILDEEIGRATYAKVFCTPRVHAQVRQ